MNMRIMPYSERDLLLPALCVLLIALTASGYLHAGTTHSGVWLLGPVIGAWVLRAAWRRRTARNAHTASAASCKDRVEFDEQEIRQHFPDGQTQAVGWHEIDEISLVCVPEWPRAQIVFWLFLSKETLRGCLVANDAEGIEELLPQAQRLPGFDSAAVLTAPGHLGSRGRVVWRRTAANARKAAAPYAPMIARSARG